MTAADTVRLLADVAGDQDVIVDRLTGWYAQHVTTVDDARLVLCTVANSAAAMSTVHPGPGQLAVVKLVTRDGAEPPWRTRLAGQLLACAMNNDPDTLTAVAHSVTTQGETPTVEVLCVLLTIYRRLTHMHTRGTR